MCFAEIGTRVFQDAIRELCVSLPKWLADCGSFGSDPHKCLRNDYSRIDHHKAGELRDVADAQTGSGHDPLPVGLRMLALLEINFDYASNAKPAELLEAQAGL